jgi:hypothetical protein
MQTSASEFSLRQSSNKDYMMPQKPGKAFVFAIVVWMVGFAWGSAVFMLAQLKVTAPIPFVSSNPWISFLDLLVLVVLFKAGLQYFASLSVFAGYALLWVVPWMVGRARQARIDPI